MFIKLRTQESPPIIYVGYTMLFFFPEEGTYRWIVFQEEKVKVVESKGLKENVSTV